MGQESDRARCEADRRRPPHPGQVQARVTDIASPLFKTDWPGAPLSKESPRRDQFHANFDFKQQDTLLEHCIDLAKAFNTDRIRCFDFWRLDDVKPYREAINKKLTEAAEACDKHGIILPLENEMSCNTGTGEEAAAVLAAIPNKNFMLNWDPGNAGTFPGNAPYPNGYDALPKDRIGHCHCKDVKREPGGKYAWEPAPGTPEASSRIRASGFRGSRHSGIPAAGARRTAPPNRQGRGRPCDMRNFLAHLFKYDVNSIQEWITLYGRFISASQCSRLQI